MSSQQMAHELAQLQMKVDRLESMLERHERIRVDQESKLHKAEADLAQLRSDFGAYQQTINERFERLYLKQQPIGGKNPRRRTAAPKKSLAERVGQPPLPGPRAPDPGDPLPGDSPELVEFLKEQKKLHNRGRK